MNANANACESTLDQSTASGGFWDEMPIHPNLWVAQGTGAAVGFSAQTGETPHLMGTIGTSGGPGVAAHGATNTVRLVASLVIPQIKVSEIQALQSLNSSLSGGGPFAELLVLARGRSLASSKKFEVKVSWMEGYASTAAWRLMGNAQVAPADPTSGTDATAFRWVNFPLFRPDIPSSNPPITATERDALASGLRTNNFPLVMSVIVQNSEAIVDGDFFDFAGAVLRYKRHRANRLPGRIGLTNGGVIGQASGVAPTFPTANPSSTPATW